MHTFTIVFWTAVFFCTWPHRAVLIAHGWTQTHRGVTLRQAVVTQTTHAFTHTPPVAMGVYGSIWENAGAGNFKENKFGCKETNPWCIHLSPVHTLHIPVDYIPWEAQRGFFYAKVTPA